MSPVHVGTLAMPVNFEKSASRQLCVPATIKVSGCVELVADHGYVGLPELILLLSPEAPRIPSLSSPVTWPTCETASCKPHLPVSLALLIRSHVKAIFFDWTGREAAPRG